MAGIFAIFKKKSMNTPVDENLEIYASKIKHRGPKHTFKFERFPIKLFFHQKKALKNKEKPLDFSISKDNNRFIAIDGHIFNLDMINQRFLDKDYYHMTDILNLEGVLNGFTEIKSKIFMELFGTYSGVIYDGSQLLGFRDPIGSKPLYYCNTEEIFVLSSELKALTDFKKAIRPVPPGSIVYSSGKSVQFYKYPYFAKSSKPTVRQVKNLAIKLNSLINISIADNIRNEEKIGILFSGGIDSTIIAHVASKILDKIHAYTVGVDGSKDLLYAQQFAELYNLNHTIVKITLNEMIDILPNVIYALETFDAALIRSSVPMFIVCQKIKDEDLSEILLTGEGGDELFGGYEYLKDFQSNQLFNNELLNLLKVEHKTGLQRVDRIPYFFSIEARAPLFDRRLVEFSFKIPNQLKIYRKTDFGIAEKWILRKAFEKEIPDKFIWRKKQKFSEGAGSQFFLRNYFNKEISDEEFETEKQLTSKITLRSKEELFYWRIFESEFNPHQETLSELGITEFFEV
jgi:asparagine synthase (glutamine-hydrolysing)